METYVVYHVHLALLSNRSVTPFLWYGVTLSHVGGMAKFYECWNVRYYMMGNVYTMRRVAWMLAQSMNEQLGFLDPLQKNTNNTHTHIHTQGTLSRPLVRCRHSQSSCSESSLP